VQSIDANNPADFHFGGLKMRFFRVLKPTFSGTPSLLTLFSAFWRLENAIFAES